MDSPEQHRALTRIRLLWGLTLALVLPMPFVAGAVTASASGMAWVETKQSGAAASWNNTALTIGVGLLLAGLYARNQVYKANWRGDVVAPAGYVRGNGVLFAAIAAAGLVALAVGIWQGLPTASYQGAIVLAGLLVFNFPSGRPMRPQPPRIGTDGEL